MTGGGDWTTSWLQAFPDQGPLQRQAPCGLHAPFREQSRSALQPWAAMAAASAVSAASAHPARTRMVVGCVESLGDTSIWLQHSTIMSTELT
jgi:hypothetical protein